MFVFHWKQLFNLNTIKLLILMKMRNAMALCAFLLLSAVSAFAQTVTGTVKDVTNGDPLPGVSIVVKGSTVGIDTDLDGAFSIPAKSGDVLALFYMGGFTATGSGGQYITVLPALNMVIAHKDKTKKMDKSTYYSIIKKVAACKE